jgi:hypothetical protein
LIVTIRERNEKDTMKSRRKTLKRAASWMLAIDFRWPVPKEGFRWEKRRLIANRLPTSEEEDRGYEPLAKTMLHRSFANVLPTPEGILDFANEYGDYAHSIAGHTQDEWRMAIQRMQLLLNLWDAAKEGNLDALDRRVRWDGQKVNLIEDANGTRWEFPDFMPAAGATKHGARLQKWLRGFKPWEPVHSVLEYVAYMVQGELQHRIWPKMHYDSERAQAQLQIAPLNLLAAIWLQFAQEISQGREHKNCAACNKAMEIAHDNSSRKSKRFCSDACRTRAYRRRREKALELYALGQSHKKIAKAVGSSEVKVRSWIAQGAKVTLRP